MKLFLALMSIMSMLLLLSHAGLADDDIPSSESGKLLLYARMIDEQEINNPTMAAQKVSEWGQGKAVRRYKDPKLLFEEGKNGPAIRFVADGKSLASAVAVFAADNFAFADQFNHGGKLEFWLKFNEDPHQFKGNKMILRTQPYPPVLTVEIYGSRPFLALEFQGNGKNPNTNYRFITYTEGWDKWYAWKQGEWHKLTLTWKRNTGSSSAEMHLFIDDSQDGCPQAKCNDYSGILPKPGSWQEVLIGSFGRSFGIDYSISKLKSFGLLYK